MFSNIAIVSKNKASNMCINWKGATSFGNFYRSDPCLDLFYKRNPRTLGDFLFPRERKNLRFSTLKKSGKLRRRLQPPSSLQHILDKGNEFEATTLQRIRALYSNRLEFFGNSVSFAQSTKNYSKTFNAMKRGDVDIIIHGVVRNYTTQTYGCPDLIVKGKAMYKLGVHTPVNNDKYYAVDIKGSKIELKVGGGIINDYKMAGYKSQLLIYALCLNEMQNDHTDTQAFILGKEYAFSSGTKFQSHQMTATANFDTHDKPYIQILNNAIDWLNWVDMYGNDPNAVYKKKEYMFPNMKNTFNMSYGSLKEQYAEHIDEITRMWNVGPGMRNVAISKNIFKLEDVKSIRDLGLQPGCFKSRIIQKMLDSRENDRIMTIPVMNNVMNWRTRNVGDNKEEWVLDIETVDDTIYMIGILTPHRYVCLTADALDSDGEKGILTELIMMMEKKDLKIWTWGHYDYTTITRKIAMYSMCLPSAMWCDVTRVLKDGDHPIVVKGALGFGLKEISSILSNTEIPDMYDGLDCKDGMTSMGMARDAYNNNDWDTMEKLIGYNKADCYTVNNIIEYMRAQ